MEQMHSTAKTEEQILGLEESLRQSEKKYRLLFENIRDIYYEISINGKILEISPSVAHYIDYSREELIGKNILDYYADPAQRESFLNDISQHGAVLNYEIIFKSRKGEIHTASINSRLMFDEINQPLKIIGTVRDVTAKKKAEIALQESKLFIQQIIANAAEGIIVYDRDLKYVVWNAFMENLTGIPAESIIGTSALERFPHLREQGIDQLLHKALNGKTCYSDDFPFSVYSTGRHGWISGLYTPLRNTANEIIGVIGMIRDVTESHRITEELEQMVRERTYELEKSEKKYRSLFEDALDIVYIIDCNGNFLAVNRTGLATYGFAAEEITGINIFQYLDPNSARIVRERIDNLVQGVHEGNTYEVLTYTRTGVPLWLEIRARAILEEGRFAAIQGMARDVTKRKQMEDALKARERELEEKSCHLEEANAALKVLLKHRDEDRITFEKSIAANMQKLVSPYLASLKATSLNKTQAHTLEIIETNINDIISPFLHSITSKYPGLTPQEIKIISLIKEGKTTKEIAGFLRLSVRTVDAHRNRIRRKIGLRNTTANLQSFINSF
ncbi:MAG: hypothetical protein CVU52_02755 [Deltaproteobacteria bacterium HGW-Deltaproteobacteria-10]|nr:MAG: hypothetical protein CVU52_02755 [Deltaproteobacteria bacterium HGW-Deltaproteobacteria-10]